MNSSALTPAAIGLLLVCYLLLGTALYFGHQRGQSPEDVGTYVVFGSALFILVAIVVVWSSHTVGRAFGF